jgi:outer membrane protein assembly factor BamA
MAMNGAGRRLFATTACILALACVAPVILSGQDAAEESSDHKRRGRFVPLPVFFVTPETGFGLGAAGLYYIQPHADAVVQQPNIISGVAFYTQNNQILTALVLDSYRRRSGDRLSVQATVQKFPDIFYGIGPNTPAFLAETYTPVEISFVIGYQWRIKPSLYLGPLYGFSLTDIKEVEEGGLLDQGTITGSEGTRASGVGARFTADTRDNYFYTRRGYLIDTQVILFSKAIGSAENFAQLQFNYRQFFTVFVTQVLALEYILDLSAGTVPFEFLPRLGGQNMMRGYREGRYRDMNYTALQAEYRFPLFWRFGAVIFGSVGKVAPDVPALFTPEYLRVAGGFGLRFLVVPQQQLNFRIDVAFQSEDTAFYINIREAF